MTRPVVWLPEAIAEFEDAVEWYSARSPGLGARFVAAVDETVATLTESPLIFAVVQKDRRRASVRRFPYGLIFIVEEERIVVLACFHGKRDPRRWQRR